MAKISTYPSADSPLLLSDRLIGTEAIRPIPSPTPLATKNFSLQELLDLFSSNFPAPSLQQVLDIGNTAAQNIYLTGTIDTTLIKTDNIEDILGSQGATFQYLSKATTGINWVDLPVDNLQAVLDKGNTATQNILLTGDITSTKIIPTNIQDELSNVGLTGQVLTKSASGIIWQNNPTPLTPSLNDVLIVGNSATNDINLTGNFYGISFRFINGNDSIIQYSGVDFNSWDLPNQSGTIALTSDIPSLAPYLLITTAASTYYPIPVGTISQYIRGDGTLATFPTVPTVVPSAMTKTNDTNVTLTLGGTPATSLLQAVSLTLGWTGTLADSRISSAVTWNAKQAALNGTGFVKASGTTISYDNSTYYLASNPSGFTSNVGTVTSVSALTIGTSGTDLSSTIATGTTTPIITLNVPTASATNRGALSSADWNTFNNKQNPLSGLTTNTVVKATSSSSIGNSNITDNGTIVTISTDAIVNGITVGRGSGNINSNNANGYQALLNNTTGNNNIADGYQALLSNSSGYNNVAVGYVALKLNNGNQNTAIGLGSTQSNTTGIRNSAVGGQSLRNNITGSDNVSIGSDSGRYLSGVTSAMATTINASVFVGQASSPLADNQTNQIVIGNISVGLGSNTTVVGNSSTTATAIYGDLLLGSTVDNGIDKLQVTGTIKSTSSVQVGNNTAAASVANVGAIRYYADTNNSYADMVMQTGTSTYAWVNIVKNTF